MEQPDNTDTKEVNRRFGLRKKLYIFFICCILSSLFWIIIKLSKDYTESLMFPVVYTNIPGDKVIINNADSVLTLQLKTKGFRLLSNMLFSKPYSINISLGSFLKKIKNSNREYYIVTSALYQVIGSQIHYSSDIVAIEPDTLHFVLEKKYTKKVPVKLRLNMSFAQQYELADSIRCQPDSVIVCGTKNIIDTLKFVETVYRSLTNIDANQYLSLDFAEKYKKEKLIITPSQAKVSVPVEKYTEASVDLTINIINNPNNNIVRTFPEKTRVTYVVSLKNFKDVKPVMFSAVADLSKALAEKSKKLKVEITKFPAYVSIRKIEPEKIEYILLK